MPTSYRILAGYGYIVKCPGYVLENDNLIDDAYNYNIELFLLGGNTRFISLKKKCFYYHLCGGGASVEFGSKDISDSCISINKSYCVLQPYEQLLMNWRIESIIIIIRVYLFYFHYIFYIFVFNIFNTHFI